MNQEKEIKRSDALYSLHEILAYLLQPSIIRTTQFREYESRYERIIKVLGRGSYPGSVFLEVLSHYESLATLREAAKTMKMQLRRITYLRPIRAALRHRGKLFRHRYAVPSDLSDAEEAASWLQELEDVCKRMVQGQTTDGDANRYDELRHKLSGINIHMLPHSVRLFSLAKEFSRELRRENKNPVWQISDEFSEARPEWPSKEGPEEEIVEDEADTQHAGDWTGRRTVSQQVQAIRQFAPIALDALDQLIDLYQRIGDNREPTKEEQHSLALLRLLHSELGTLLAAAETGRPFSAALKKVGKTARRVFGIAVETKELLIVGTPAIAAAALTSLAALKGLELCGIDVGIAETGAALGLTGTVYGAHSVTERVTRSSKHRE